MNREFIEKKLSACLRYVERLEGIVLHSDEEITNDFLKLHALERLIQLIVDEIIDVNTHIIRNSALETPDDFQGSFATLASGGILPEQFAQKIAPVVGPRNRLVHRYEEIDATGLIRMARDERNDFRKYAKYITEFLEKK